MSQTALNFAIENAFQVLARQSMELFDAWYEVLHNEWVEGNILHSEVVESEWNATNLDLMLQGVAPVA